METLTTTTPKIKWVSPSRVLGKCLASMLQPEEMLKDFLRFDLINQITDNYASDVYMMCRNGATWLGAKMNQIAPGEIEVIEGTFLGDSHCWVVCGDYYFDMTIAQSDSSYPKFAVVHIKNAVGYEEFMRFSVEDWMQNSLNQ